MQGPDPLGDERASAPVGHTDKYGWILVYVYLKEGAFVNAEKNGQSLWVCLSSFSFVIHGERKEVLHNQGKKVGSHTDGDIKPLLGLLAESGLDVCESFSPAPLTECTFEEAWNAWQDGPIIWGGIPSPILEERTRETDFRDYVRRVLETVGDRPIILGVGDMVMGNNMIERVRYIANRVENHVVGR